VTALLEIALRPRLPHPPIAASLLTAALRIPTRRVGRLLAGGRRGLLRRAAGSSR
jgi:hypothetical protein